MAAKNNEILPQPQQPSSHSHIYSPHPNFGNAQPHSLQNLTHHNLSARNRRRRNYRSRKDTVNMVGYIPPHLRGKASASNPGPQPVTESSIFTTHISNVSTQPSKAANTASSIAGRATDPKDHSCEPTATKEDPPISTLSTSVSTAGAAGGLYMSAWTDSNPKNTHAEPMKGILVWKDATVHVTPEKKKTPANPTTSTSSQKPGSFNKQATPGLTIGTSSAHSDFSRPPCPKPSSAKAVLPDSTWPTKPGPSLPAMPPFSNINHNTRTMRPQTASVKSLFPRRQPVLATSIADLKSVTKSASTNHASFKPASTKVRSPPSAESPVSPPQQRRNGWLTKAERKNMKPKPLPTSSDTEHDGWVLQDNVDWDDNRDCNLPEMHLRQWNGEWLPGPVEWEGRRGYKTDTFADDVAKWVDRTNACNLHMRNSENPKIRLSTREIKSELWSSEKKNAEYAPRCWIPEQVEGSSLQSFWQSLLQSSLEPVDEDDLKMSPFWHRYIGNECDFQVRLNVPEAYLDAADNLDDPEMYFKGKSESADSHIEKKAREALLSKKQRNKLRHQERRERQMEARKPKIAFPPNPHKPTVNIYLRLAMSIDIDQILLIFNHYALRTCYSADMTEMSRPELVDKMHDIQRAGLNMIVAIQKVSQPAGLGAPLHSTQEKLVGFAFSEEHEGRDAMFRYAADLEIYVHPQHLRKGVGKSLIDRMMFLLDPMYSLRDVVEWRAPPDEISLNTPGGKRIITTVRINVLYPTDEPVRAVWLERWLLQFNFEKRGQFEGGIKDRKEVHQAIFQLKTGQNVKPTTTFIGSVIPV